MTQSFWSSLRAGFVVAAVSATSAICATSASAESLTLAHTYKALGTNPNGSAYEGTVTIDILSTTTFGIRWSIGGGIYEGFGMRLNNTLAATYTIDGHPGLVIYQVQGNGLDGLWSVKGQNGSGTERLIPVN